MTTTETARAMWQEAREGTRGAMLWNAGVKTEREYLTRVGFDSLPANVRAALTSRYPSVSEDGPCIVCGQVEGDHDDGCALDSQATLTGTVCAHCRRGIVGADGACADCGGR